MGRVGAELTHPSPDGLTGGGWRGWAGRGEAAAAVVLPRGGLADPGGARLHLPRALRPRVGGHRHGPHRRQVVRLRVRVGQDIHALRAGIKAY